MLQLHWKVNKMLQVVPLSNAATQFGCNVPEPGLRQKIFNKLTASSTCYKTIASTKFPLISKQLASCWVLCISMLHETKSLIH